MLGSLRTCLLSAVNQTQDISTVLLVYCWVSKHIKWEPLNNNLYNNINISYLKEYFYGCENLIAMITHI